MKILSAIKKNIFLAFTLFLLFFIPLYPKLPLIGLSHINVYIRAEDFIISVVVLVYLFNVIRRKQSIKTPLTIAIAIFWLSGLVSTVLGLLFIFPHLNDPTITGNPLIYTRNALLFFARHVEYMSLFFVAYASIKEKKNIKPVIVITVVTYFFVVLYGFGQRFLPQHFPAFSTMNEEFAKGIPLVLDAAGRLQSTFAGHYDFGAYLVMLIPIIGSLVFGYKNWYLRIGLIILDVVGFIALLMTESRTSFFMYLLAVMFMLIIQKQKKWIIPVVIVSFLLLRTFNGLYARYAATFSTVNRIVDARTGKVIGYADNENGKFVVNNVQPSGQDLYAGSLSTNGKKIGKATNITIKSQKGNAKSIDVENLQGNFIIQKASALDASLTTRLQAEWPNAITAFKRNILFGSGYSSISLATDGNYFRFLGETGLLGFGFFALIFLIYGIYLAKILPDIDDSLTKSFVIGVAAGIFGLCLNATLIDVFESSKIAYTLWLLVGVSVGILQQYKKATIPILQEIKAVILSVPTILALLIVSGAIIFWPIVSNFFVADDFTWLKWVSECKILMQNGATNCSSKLNIIASFFLHSQNFFYRPGMKLYFYILYNSLFGGISPVMYHLVSLFLHIAITILVFLLAQKILKDKLSAFIVSVIFLVLSSHAEAIYWVSASGHLFATFFALISLWLYIKWTESKTIYLLILSILSSFAAPLFHEYGVIAPLLVIVYAFLSQKLEKKKYKHFEYFYYIAVLVVYFFLKTVSRSFWSAGNYRYNLVKLPLNFFGNLFGAIGYIFVGSPFLSVYDSLRSAGRSNITLFSIILVLGIAIIVLLYREYAKKVSSFDKNVFLKSLIFLIVPLFPFLGLGNVAPRYTYLSSFGLLLLAVYILKKVYVFVKNKNELIGFLVIFLIPLLFIYIQLQGLKAENSDWNKAGMISNNFIQYMNDGYEDLGLGDIKNPIFYYVNVPTQYKTAWVFPTGVGDATWFTYKDRNLTSEDAATIDDARKDANGIKNARIFVFDKDYNVHRVHN